MNNEVWKIEVIVNSKAAAEALQSLIMSPAVNEMLKLMPENGEIIASCSYSVSEDRGDTLQLHLNEHGEESDATQ